MTNGFTKLFNSIITSSVWSEDDKTRLMWITMLASSDAEGFVTGSIPGMAAIARMSLKEAEQSIKALMKPDPYSRSKEYDGCRLLECDGGWLIVNYQKYRAKRDPEKRRQQNRDAQRRYRQKKKVIQRKPKVSQSNPESAQAEAEAEAEEKNPPISPQGDERFSEFWRAYPKKVGKKDAEKAFKKIKPSDELLKKMLAALEEHKKLNQWLKDEGQYIPNPASWLNKERWNDKLEIEVKKDGAISGSSTGSSTKNYR